MTRPLVMVGRSAEMSIYLLSFLPYFLVLLVMLAIVWAFVAIEWAARTVAWLASRRSLGSWL